MKAICKIASPTPVVTPKLLSGPAFAAVASWMPLMIATKVATPKTTPSVVHKPDFTVLLMGGDQVVRPHHPGPAQRMDSSVETPRPAASGSAHLDDPGVDEGATQVQPPRSPAVARQRADAMSPEEIRAWVKKHIANAPERDEQWQRSVLAIYRPEVDWSEVVLLPQDLDRPDD